MWHNQNLRVQVCPELILELSVELMEYQEESEKTNVQTHEMLFMKCCRKRDKGLAESWKRWERDIEIFDERLATIATKQRERLWFCKWEAHKKKPLGAK